MIFIHYLKQITYDFNHTISIQYGLTGIFMVIVKYYLHHKHGFCMMSHGCFSITISLNI